MPAPQGRGARSSRSRPRGHLPCEIADSDAGSAVGIEPEIPDELPVKDGDSAIGTTSKSDSSPESGFRLSKSLLSAGNSPQVLEDAALRRRARIDGGNVVAGRVRFSMTGILEVELRVRQPSRWWEGRQLNVGVRPWFVLRGMESGRHLAERDRVGHLGIVRAAVVPLGSGLGFLGSLGLFAMVSETPRIAAETQGRMGAARTGFDRKCYFSLSREAMGEQYLSRQFPARSGGIVGTGALYPARISRMPRFIGRVDQSRFANRRSGVMKTGY